MVCKNCGKKISNKKTGLGYIHRNGLYNCFTFRGVPLYADPKRLIKEYYDAL